MDIIYQTKSSRNVHFDNINNNKDVIYANTVPIHIIQTKYNIYIQGCLVVFKV